MNYFFILKIPYPYQKKIITFFLDNLKCILYNNGNFNTSEIHHIIFKIELIAVNKNTYFLFLFIQF